METSRDLSSTVFQTCLAAACHIISFEDEKELPCRLQAQRVRLLLLFPHVPVGPRALHLLWPVSGFPDAQPGASTDHCIRCATIPHASCESCSTFLPLQTEYVSSASLDLIGIENNRQCLRQLSPLCEAVQTLWSIFNGFMLPYPLVSHPSNLPVAVR